GHRNPQGAAIHPVTGELWTVEHGAKGGDELNRPEGGKNYGWPTITYGIDYSGTKLGEGTAKAGMEQPVYYWDPVIAPSNLIFYKGDMFSGWNGNLLIGALSTSVKGLVRLVLDGNKVVAEERILNSINRIRDLEVDAAGAIWVVTDGGQLIKVTKR
ncbi:MAG TPA: PQQ-dependent sugar dehydrogenase, partial [Marinagarivorans sp.]|nr:PQQ-dependent sugar dehydrogenase [Marinagarivorans sp.]